MRKIVLLLASLLSGCVTYGPLLPEGYSGDVATIDDTFKRLSGGKANLYFVDAVNGQKIKNGLTATSEQSSDKGLQLIPTGASRRVPVKPLTLHIIARTYQATPLIMIMGTHEFVEGDVSFTPEINKKYLVRGSLENNYFAVWIEDVDGTIVSNVIENKSSKNRDSVVSKKATVEKRTDKKVLSRVEKFIRLSTGESEGVVVERIGEPDRITENRRNIFVNRPNYTIYHYQGLGDVQFIGLRSGEMHIDRIIPKIRNHQDPVFVASKQLETDDGYALRFIAKDYYSKPELEQSVLDLLARKLWKERKTKNGYMVDAMAWFCKVIGKSKNPRYTELLTSLTKDANSKKLRKYAKENLDALPADVVEQFKPTTMIGTVSS